MAAQLDSTLSILLLCVGAMFLTLGWFLSSHLDVEHVHFERGGSDAAMFQPSFSAISAASAAKDLSVWNPTLQHYPSRKGTGVFIMGMHRSGTSMLAGLLTEGMGYNAGGPLKPAFKFNKKGYYELQPLIDQNSVWMEDQVIDVINNPYSFDANMEMEFDENGQAVLALLKSGSEIPYMVKSPTVCLTLPLWLQQLSVKPAVVFTFRHPMDVAYSLEKRERHPIRFGMRAWIAYYRRSVDAMHKFDLCRVVTSYIQVLDNPLLEVSRIAQELTERCGVAPPPKQLSADVVAEFADPSLNHALTMPTNETVLEYYTDECTIYNHPRILLPHLGLWHRVSRIFCDLQSEKAFEKGYDWHIDLEKDADF